MYWEEQWVRINKRVDKDNRLLMEKVRVGKVCQFLRD